MDFKMNFSEIWEAVYAYYRIYCALEVGQQNVEKSIKKLAEFGFEGETQKAYLSLIESWSDYTKTLKQHIKKLIEHLEQETWNAQDLLNTGKNMSI